MADVTIAQLPTLAVEPTDVVEIQKTDGGESGKYTVQELANLAPTGVAWGQITGNLANQTDLQAALDAKADADAYLPLTGGDLDGTLSAIDIIGVRSGTYPLFFTKSSNAGNAATGELRMSDLNGVQIAQIGVLSNSHNDLYIRANLGELVFQPEGNITAGRWSATGLDVLGTLDVGGAFTTPGITDQATSTALTIDGSQRVGIGTSTPQQLLHVFSDSGAPRIFLESADAGADAILDVRAPAGRSSYIYMTETGAFDGAIQYAHNNKSLRLYTTGTEALRIDSSQNVLVGTTGGGSSSKLKVFAADNAFIAGFIGNTYGLRVQSNSTAGDMEVAGVDSTLAGSFQPLAITGEVLKFRTGIGQAEALRIDSSQNVDIPAGTLRLLQNNKMFWSSGASTERASIVGDNSNNLIFTTGGSSIERLRIDTSGAVVVSNLAGAGTRNVQVQADGTLIAV